MSDTYAAAAAQAERLERAAQNDELATLIAEKLIAAQRDATRAETAAAVAPIRRADFDRLNPAAAMALVKSGRRVID